MLEITPGETILARTVRLVRELTAGRVRICCPVFWPGIKWSTIQSVDAEWVLPAPGESPTLIDNMRAARFDYSETLFLLGDVVWSRAGLRHVFAHVPRAGHPVFYLRPGVNAATGKDWGETFAFCCEWNCELPPAVSLWMLARAFAHHCERVAMPEGDWTDDIDTPDELKRFYPKLGALAAGDP